MSERTHFHPMQEALLRKFWNLPGNILSYRFDEQLNGYWLEWDKSVKNTVSDPRDVPSKPKINQTKEG